MSQIDRKNLNILVVDDDQVLAQVVGRVLSQQGFTVRHATNVRGALEVAQEHPPGLALLDLCLPDGDGVELAARLREKQAGLPLLLMTAYPLRAKEKPALAELGAQVLTKPFSPATLRQAVNEALAASHPEYTHESRTAPAEVIVRPDQNKTEAMPTGTPRSFIPSISQGPPRPVEVAPAASVKEFFMRVFLVKHSKTAGLVGLIVVVLIGLAMVTGLVRSPWVRASDDKREASRPKAAGVAADLQVELVPNKPHTLSVPPEVRETLGIRKAGVDKIVVAEPPKSKQQLVLPGASALDPARIYRVRARFAPSPSSAKCVKIGQMQEDPARSGKPGTTLREIRTGDPVVKDQVLAVFDSVDVGSKKNDLVDALVLLKQDEDILNRAEEVASSGGLSEVFLLTALRNMEADRNAVARAENTLRTWDIPEQDIHKVKEEAKEIGKQRAKREPKTNENDKEWQKKVKEWAKVVLRAPDDGIIIERNLTLGEAVVDNTTNLFQIAKVDRLAVYAYCPEDDLPKLHALPTAKRRWTVQTVGSPPLSGFFSDISYIIDPNQHTAVVKGYIDNPGGVVRAGQFVSVTIELDPPDDIVEIPSEAVSEDGQQAVVFVQKDKDKPYYTMRRVHLEARFDKKVWVRSKLAKGEQRTSQEEELGILPKEPLVPGDRVLGTAVGELKAALLDRESQPGKK